MAKPAERPMQFSLRALLLVVAGCAVVLSIYFSAVSLIRYVEDKVSDAYAVEWVVTVVIDHMETHDGAWPQNWDDLRAAYSRYGNPWDFDDLRSRVCVDFDADPEKLVLAEPRPDGPPFRVVYLCRGGDTHGVGGEPNQRILDYLKRKAEAAESDHPDQRNGHGNPPNATGPPRPRE